MHFAPLATSSTEPGRSGRMSPATRESHHADDFEGELRALGGD